MARTTELRFDVGAHGKTSGAVYRAADPVGATLVFAHGAGAPRTHPFVVGLAKKLAARGVDVVTFNFLYAEAGRRAPDRVELLETCWRAAIAKVRARTGLETSPLFVGGKSMGGRIATRVAGAKEGLVIDGVVCVGYPLHPPGKPDVARAEILSVDLPLLVVQGTRDAFGGAAVLKKYLRRRANARVVAIEDGDHSLEVPKRAERDALAEAADAIATFVKRLVKEGGA
ncbi:MAG: alpha/beta fold hydrolase [Labilithrix sp.]|nr:alpha/beta fold hydrolase [Labilithrix sp.]MCW5811408.1 alpha/beta fold hydrolase [Labilithrix sp.]